MTHVFDLPWNFVAAWQRALTILNWQENLPEEDMPPRYIWRDSDKLDAHFEKIKGKWKGKGEDNLDAPMGDFDDVNSGHRVQIKNRLGDYVRESMTDAHDDFSNF